MSIQLNHDNTPLQNNKQSLIIICDDLESPANIGGLFRLCDALGIETICFCRNKPDINSVRLKRTSRNTHTHILQTYFENTLDAISFYKKQGFNIIALELTNKSISLNQFQPEANQKVALVIGNEKNGVSEEVLSILETHVHINMLGKNSSMNVVQATAIACYSLTKN